MITHLLVAFLGIGDANKKRENGLIHDWLLCQNLPLFFSELPSDLRSPSNVGFSVKLQYYTSNDIFAFIYLFLNVKRQKIDVL